MKHNEKLKNHLSGSIWRGAYLPLLGHLCPSPPHCTKKHTQWGYGVEFVEIFRK